MTTRAGQGQPGEQCATKGHDLVAHQARSAGLGSREERPYAVAHGEHSSIVGSRDPSVSVSVPEYAAMSLKSVATW
jgi:hypothetical protein